MTPIITPFPVPPPIPQNNPMKITISFRDGNGSPFDPDSSILIRAINPVGVETTYNYPADVTREGVGVYSVIVVAISGGDWLFSGQGKLADGKPVTTPDVMQYVAPTALP